MRKKNLILLSSAVLLLLVSLNALQAQTEYKLGYFDAISVAGNIEVHLIKGEKESAMLETYGIPEDEVNISVNRQTLRLSLLNSVFQRSKKVRITVTYTELRSVRGNAGAMITADHILQGDFLEVRAGSGAQVMLEVDANKLDAGATEGGTLQLRGQVNSQKAQAATGGLYEAFNLISKNTYARSGTGGQMQVTALEVLDAYANLGGSIEYKGEPEERYHRKFIGGEVRRVEF